MADALWMCRTGIEADRERWSRRLPPGGYLGATLHRQANVDDPRRLASYMRAFMRLAQGGVPVVFPVHPRTRKRLTKLGLVGEIEAAGVRLRPPLPYLEFLGLVASSAAVITDSGGLQVEAALLQVPCVTARRTTEHQLTLTHGRNVLAGTDPRRLRSALLRAWQTALPAGKRPRAWDGHAAERIVADLDRGFLRPARLPSPDAWLC